MLKYNFIGINDFRVIFWQKLGNLYDIICAINLFSVKIDKNKLQSANYNCIIGVFSIEKF